MSIAAVAHVQPTTSPIAADKAPWLHVVGIGDDGLDGLPPTAHLLIDQAEAIVGGVRHLAMLGSAKVERIAWASPLTDTLDVIARLRGRRVVVLASGDPSWFGVATALARRFTPDDMVLHPYVSAFQLTAARLLWPMQECTCLSLHGRDFTALHRNLQPGRRLLLLSHDAETPARVAETLRTRGFSTSTLHVFSHLAGAAETRVDATAATWPDNAAVADLNTLAVELCASPGALILPLGPGLPDDAFIHDGQLTKREVRAVILAHLIPLPGQMFWDLAAGSGAVAIEWLRAGGGGAHAVERDEQRCVSIAQNAAYLGTPELVLHRRSVDAALADLPTPDAVFVGGGLDDTPDLLARVHARLEVGGRLVASAVTLASEGQLLAAHARFGGSLTRIGIEHAAPIGATLGFKPKRSVTLWALTR